MYDSVLTEGDNAALLDDAFEEMDSKDVKRAVKKDKSRQARHMAAMEPQEPVPAGGGGSAGNGGGSSGGASGSEAPRCISAPSTFTPAWMKSWLPDVPGCFIKFDDSRRNRFQVGYPKTLPPRTHTSRFGEASGVVVFAAFIDSISWAWHVHKLETGADCPYDLEASLALALGE